MNFVRYTDVADIKALIQSHNWVKQPVALDFETTGLDPWKDNITDIVMLGLSPKHVVSFGAEFLPLLLDLEAPTVWHNFKFDFEMAYRAGIDLRHMIGVVRDTMLMDHLNDENLEHGLDAIVQRRWNDSYKAKFWEQYESFKSAPVQEQVDYMCRDVYYTNLLYHALAAEIAAQDIPGRLTQFVHELAFALYATEITGVRLDTVYTAEIGLELKKKIVDVNKAMRESCDTECGIVEMGLWLKELEKRKTEKGKAGVQRPAFNFGSTQQVCSLLYDVLGLDVQIDPKTKNRTKGDQALKKLERAHPVVSLMRDSSKYNKMYGSFIEGVLKKEVNGRIYPRFHINGTVTGRISASSPNMQQMPSQGEWTKLRGMFVPSPGFVFGTCDYSQLEICLAAHYSADPVLIDMVRRGDSMHTKTAEATGLNREQAKKLNFTVLYGGTEYKVAHDLGCSIEEAKGYLAMLFKKYAGLKALMEDCHYKAQHGLPIRNIFGRIRHFTGDYGTRAELNRAKRQSFNSLIQGTGADITHTAFVEIYDWLKNESKGKASTLFPVHDEIVFECKPDYFELVSTGVMHIMQNVALKLQLKVPLVAEPSEAMDRWTK